MKTKNINQRTESAVATPAGEEQIKSTPVTYQLDSGVKRLIEWPDTFQIPPRRVRESLKVGNIVKLIFLSDIEGFEFAERMWVEVTNVESKHYVGKLASEPVITDGIDFGSRVEFHADHVIDLE